MDTSWKSVYNQKFETPDQGENRELSTYEHSNLDNFIHYLSTNELQENEPFISSHIVKNEMGENKGWLIKYQSCLILQFIWKRNCTKPMPI